MPEFKKEDEGQTFQNHAVQAQLDEQEKATKMEMEQSLKEAEKEIGHKLTDKVLVTNPDAQNAQIKKKLEEQENTVVYKSYA